MLEINNVQGKWSQSTLPTFARFTVSYVERGLLNAKCKRFVSAQSTYLFLKKKSFLPISTEFFYEIKKKSSDQH